MSTLAQQQLAILEQNLKDLTAREQVAWREYKRLWEETGVQKARNLWIDTLQEMRKAQVLFDAFQQQNLCESQPLPPGTSPGATSM